MRNPKLTLKQNSRKKWHWNLKSSNSKAPVQASQGGGYETEDGCIDGFNASMYAMECIIYGIAMVERINYYELIDPKNITIIPFKR